MCSAASPVGSRLVERGPQVPVIDPRQDLPSLDRLVVVHQHLGDVAGDARRDDDRVGLHVGVVGLDLEPADLPVAHAECRRRDEAKRPGQAGKRPLQPVRSRRPRLPAPSDNWPARSPRSWMLSPRRVSMAALLRG